MAMRTETIAQLSTSAMKITQQERSSTDTIILHLPVRDRQDEYLEWVALRNSDGKIVKIIFVAEGYDYFSELFSSDEGRALEIYKDFTGGIVN